MAIWAIDNFEFYHRTTRERSYKTASHFHDVHELYYLVKGSTRYFIGSEVFELSAGEIAFAPKGVFHNTNSEKMGEAERILLEFDDEFAGEDYKKYVNFLISRKHICFSPTDVVKIEELLNKIAEESTAKYDDYREMQKLYLRELLIFIYRHSLKGGKARSSASFEVIERVMKYISEKPYADLTLKGLSEKFSISSNHLSKQFKKVSGLLLSEYINISRISYAESLLKKGNMPITRVATECGFNDSNYFASVFKKYKGITPKKYSMVNK